MTYDKVMLQGVLVMLLTLPWLRFGQAHLQKYGIRWVVRVVVATGYGMGYHPLREAAEIISLNASNTPQVRFGRSNYASWMRGNKPCRGNSIVNNVWDNGDYQGMFV